MSASLVLQFEGWCVIRLPTDPDPPDEPRGVSGYTFAFAGEPDFDRIVHLQPPADWVPRSHGPDKLGVFVADAKRVDTSGEAKLPALLGAKVELLGEPRLENRNWTLTLPGFEPIYPFDLSITGGGVAIRRSAPFDPDHPDLPIWQVPLEKLLAQGAQGMEFEPQTIGRATGMWDPALLVAQRKRLLEEDLEALRNGGTSDPLAEAALSARIYELAIGVANPHDRRVMARVFVERFSFPMLGKDAGISGGPDSSLGSLDPAAPWQVSFWLGSWDPDLLCAYLQGSLVIPYLASVTA